MRRAQATVLLAALLLPAGALAATGLACLAARAQAERAQRIADGAALAMAVGAPPVVPGDARVSLQRIGPEGRATVELAAMRFTLPVVGRVGFAARASATARSVQTDDGRTGAALVG